VVGFYNKYDALWALFVLPAVCAYGLLCVSQNLVYSCGTVSSDPRLPVLAVTHIGHSKPNSFKRLACGVFNQALRDCGLLSSARIEKELQREAIRFLTHGGEDFRFWCQALDLHPDRMQSALRRRLIHPPSKSSFLLSLDP